ncbi:hypothetical protein [Pleurocapsa sp. FMAR1]|uniref:hypothetical protein n=1 Tax=Pleurocapsa sp. FMAR1 TaxID=3040204 RepID=UPI0029C6D8E3|nr:hypothetical protein [Pleurocapsa sp. FMAR1]
MENSIKKDIILNGTDSITVFKEDGLVYRAKDLESYTPIVLKNLRANIEHTFDLESVSSCNYQVIRIVTDVKADDDVVALDEQTASSYTSASGFISVIRQGKRVYQQYFTFTQFVGTYNALFFETNDLIRVKAFEDTKSITLYCQPVYLEKTIIVPEVITDEPVIS